MTLRHLTGFEIQSGGSFYASEGWTVAVANGLSTVAGRLGGTAATHSVGASTPACDLNHNLDAALSGTTIVVGFAFYNGFAGVDRMVSGAVEFLQLRSGGSRICSFRLVSSGGGRVIQLLNAGATVGANGATLIANGAWYYVEAKITLSATVGTMVLRINGITERSLTGVNTGTTLPNNLRLLGAGTGGGESQATRWDDIYVLDGAGAINNDFLGEQRIVLLNPIGAGNSTVLTPSAGANWQCVDENVSNGDTDFVSSSTPGDTDTYDLENLPTALVNVAGVKTIIAARKDDAAARQIAPVLRIGGTDYVGSSSPGLGTSFSHYTQLYDRDPTVADWSASTVDGMELGVQVVA